MLGASGSRWTVDSPRLSRPYLTHAGSSTFSDADWTKPCGTADSSILTKPLVFSVHGKLFLFQRKGNRWGDSVLSLAELQQSACAVMTGWRKRHTTTNLSKDASQRTLKLTLID